LIDTAINIVLQAPGMPKPDANKIPIFEWVEPYVYGDPYPCIKKLFETKGHDGYFYLNQTTVTRSREVFPNANIEIRIPTDIDACITQAIKEGDVYFAHLKYINYWFPLLKSKLFLEVRDCKYNHPDHKMITINEYMQKHDTRNLEDIWRDTINKCVDTILTPGLTQL